MPNWFQYIARSGAVGGGPRAIHAKNLGLPMVPLALMTCMGCGAGTSDSVTSVSRMHKMDSSAVVAYDGRGRGAYLDKRSDRIVICAEPPPDVTANLSAESTSSTNANLDALIKAVTIKAAFEHDENDNATSTVVDVATRTEVILILREALYRLCELNFNGILDRPQTINVFDYILRTARQLGQRDNVAKLIEAMRAEQSPEFKGKILQVILAMSYAESAAASTGLDAAAQETSTRIFSETLNRLYGDKSGPINPGGTGNK